MPLPLCISSHRNDRIVRTRDELIVALSTTDSRGGGEFWLTALGQDFPSLVVRISAGQADVHFFPAEGNPGFRRLADHPLPEDVLLQFEGCDPSDGEWAPGSFVIPQPEAFAVVDYFVEHGSMREPARWLQL